MHRLTSTTASQSQWSLQQAANQEEDQALFVLLQGEQIEKFVAAFQGPDKEEKWENYYARNWEKFPGLCSTIGTQIFFDLVKFVKDDPELQFMKGDFQKGGFIHAMSNFLTNGSWSDWWHLDREQIAIALEFLDPTDLSGRWCAPYPKENFWSDRQRTLGPEGFADYIDEFNSKFFALPGFRNFLTEAPIEQICTLLGGENQKIKEEGVFQMTREQFATIPSERINALTERGIGNSSLKFITNVRIVDNNAIGKPRFFSLLSEQHWKDLSPAALAVFKTIEDQVDFAHLTITKEQLEAVT